MQNIDKLKAEIKALKDESEKLKKGICEHVKEDVLSGECRLCGLALAEKTAEHWVPKGRRLEAEIKALKEENRELRSVMVEYLETIDKLKARPVILPEKKIPKTSPENPDAQEWTECESHNNAIDEVARLNKNVVSVPTLASFIRDKATEWKIPVLGGIATSLARAIYNLLNGGE